MKSCSFLFPFREFQVKTLKEGEAIALQHTLNTGEETGFVYNIKSERILSPLFVGDCESVYIDFDFQKNNEDVGVFHTHPKKTLCEFSDGDFLSLGNLYAELRLGCVENVSEDYLIPFNHIINIDGNDYDGQKIVIKHIPKNDFQTLLQKIKQFKQNEKKYFQWKSYASLNINQCLLVKSNLKKQLSQTTNSNDKETIHSILLQMKQSKQDFLLSEKYSNYCLKPELIQKSINKSYENYLTSMDNKDDFLYKIYSKMKKNIKK